MAPSYYNSNSHSSTRDHFVESPSLLSRILLSLPPSLAAQMQRLWSYASSDKQAYTPVSTATPHSRVPRRWQRWHPRQLLSLPHLFVLAWVLALLWGERWVFQSSVESCGWDSWERWVSSVGWYDLEIYGVGTDKWCLDSPRKQRRII